MAFPLPVCSIVYIHCHEPSIKQKCKKSSAHQHQQEVKGAPETAVIWFAVSPKRPVNLPTDSESPPGAPAAAGAGETIRITVKNVSGGTVLVLRVKTSKTVQALKLKIQEVRGIPPEQQRLEVVRKVGNGESISL